MILYFDTNVFNFIADRQECNEVREFLSSYSHKVVASSENLTEMLAIRDDLLRRYRISALTSIATSFEPKPESWHHAFEVQCEVRRCRRRWLKVSPRRGDIKEITELKQAHLEKWNLAKKGVLPSAMEFAPYHRDSELGIARHCEFQQFVRKKGQENEHRFGLTIGSSRCDVDYTNPEQAWRADSAMVWFNAIVMQNPSMRDYFDWLGPYLTEDAFADDSFIRFWMSDIEADRVPYNRITGLSFFYQTRQKVTHGNAIDVLHANKMLSCDVFVTGDKGLFRVLESLGSHFQSGIAKPVLLDQSASSAVDGIRVALESI